VKFTEAVDKISADLMKIGFSECVSPNGSKSYLKCELGVAITVKFDYANHRIKHKTALSGSEFAHEAVLTFSDLKLLFVALDREETINTIGMMDKFREESLSFLTWFIKRAMKNALLNVNMYGCSR